ncbi:ATP-binding protein [Streptomyces sp. NBC_01456]|uniref:ATP-binding protein n=1 Tax=unclassified Streptomyces TaxID=2593676 RepID=UPI002E316C8B|nr:MULTISPECIES: ATP-binding protein [unclassified Streptomyces]
METTQQLSPALRTPIHAPGDGSRDDDAADSVVLMVSELVTNAVEHAQPPLVLHVSREHTALRVWVGVTDGGPATREGPWTSSCAYEEHGRGLSMVKALASAHGAHSHGGGTTHWARMPVAYGELLLMADESGES